PGIPQRARIPWKFSYKRAPRSLLEGGLVAIPVPVEEPTFERNYRYSRWRRNRQPTHSFGPGSAARGGCAGRRPAPPGGAALPRGPELPGGPKLPRGGVRLEEHHRARGPRGRA